MELQLCFPPQSFSFPKLYFPSQCSSVNKGAFGLRVIVFLCRGACVFIKNITPELYASISADKERETQAIKWVMHSKAGVHLQCWPKTRVLSRATQRSTIRPSIYSKVQAMKAKMTDTSRTYPDIVDKLTKKHLTDTPKKNWNLRHRHKETFV